GTKLRNTRTKLAKYLIDVQDTLPCGADILVREARLSYATSKGIGLEVVAQCQNTLQVRRRNFSSATCPSRAATRFRYSPSGHANTETSFITAPHGCMFTFSTILTLSKKFWSAIRAIS